jgi:hypothetical protein
MEFFREVYGHRDVSGRSLQANRETRSGATEMQIELTAVFQKVPEGNIGFVEELPGANTQGANFEEARKNLQKRSRLCST